MKTVQSQSTSNPSSISQIAATEAINGSQDCVENMVIEYKKRNDFIVEALNNISGFECNKGDGAFYAFPRVDKAIQSNNLKNDIELAALILNKAGVVVVPGTPFGAPGYIRLSYACSIIELEKAVDRITNAIK
jgi:aspartate aminotransferase